jgi:nucleoside-diphosphate-sugar epimerase
VLSEDSRTIHSLAASLVTGASGYLGGLITATLLATTSRRVLLPVRSAHDPSACLARIRRALLERGVRPDVADECLIRASITELPAVDRVAELEPLARAHGVDEIIHSAGCLDYFDERNLYLVNVDLTTAFLALAHRLGVLRFFYLSTAYCSGYRTGTIHEELHSDPAPADEPTDYTRTKRMAEWRVAGSGTPYVIIRPSIVIGDSRTGRYSGKNYGLYQMWRAIEGLLCREYAPIWHTVAPPTPLNFVHQDAFQNAFMAAHRSLQNDVIIHIVSDDAKSPTMRDLCWLWADVYRPEEIHCYETVDDVPLRSIPTRQRRFLELAHKNLEIAGRRWRFETRHLDAFRAAGLSFADVTLETVARCQQRYIEGSQRIQDFIRLHAGRASGRSRLIEMPSRSLPRLEAHEAS